MLGRGRALGDLRSSQHRAEITGYLEAEAVCVESITLVMGPNVSCMGKMHPNGNKLVPSLLIYLSDGTSSEAGNDLEFRPLSGASE